MFQSGARKVKRPQTGPLLPVPHRQTRQKTQNDNCCGMDDLKAIFDPSHFDLLNGARGRPEDLLLELGVDRIGYVQFCDGDSTLRPFPSGGAGTSRHLPCGEGVYDIVKLCSILDEGGFRGWFQMDSWGTEDAYWTSKSCKDAVVGYLEERIAG